MFFFFPFFIHFSLIFESPSSLASFSAIKKLAHCSPVEEEDKRIRVGRFHGNLSLGIIFCTHVTSVGIPFLFLYMYVYTYIHICIYI